MNSLEGRTAIVTGASGGLGVHISQALANEGVNLVLSSLSENLLSELATQLSARTKIVTIATDLASRRDLQTLLMISQQYFGDPDVLVNNAGVELFSKYHFLSEEDIQRTIDVNLTGPMLLTRIVLPGMLRRGRGHIVNVSSLSAKAGPPFAESYAATKAGLIAFTESLRAEYRETGISASVICPGFVEAGIYQRIVEATGLVSPWILGTSAPEVVAQAVIRAIKKDIPEIIINPGPTRILTTLAELSPRFPEWFLRRFGIVDWFRKVAEARKQKDFAP